jgi:hypothetical protein
MADGAGAPVKLPDGYHVKTAPVSVGHESVQFWPSVLSAGHPVNALTGDGPASAPTMFAKLAQLHFRGLSFAIGSRDPRVDGYC